MHDHDALRLKHTPALVDELLNDLADRVAGRVRAVPKEARQSGNDTIHRDVWEEFKDQIKGQHSFMFDLYEDMVRMDCESVLEGLPRYQRELIWLWSELFLDRDSYPGDAPSYMTMEALLEILYRRVCERADAEDMLFDEYRVARLMPGAHWEGFSEVDLSEIEPESLIEHMSDVVRFMEGQEDYGEGIALTMAERYLEELADRDGVDLDEDASRDRVEEHSTEFHSYLQEWCRRVLAVPPEPE